MNVHTDDLPIFPMALAILLMGAASTASGDDGEEDETPFDEAVLFFELNDTDGDLGIHALIDGDEWKKLTIEDPEERAMLDVWVKGRLRKQGLTELFFESAEPPFEELSPEQFFQRFPEGEYDIEGQTLEGTELESTVSVSHVMPAGASNIQISGLSAAENCDADPLPTVNGDDPVIISWAPVTQSHPQIGRAGTIEVDKYQFIVEREEPSLLVFSVDLPPSVTEFEVPAAFIDLGEEFKFEIVVRAANGNQTAVESCFNIE